MDRNIPTGDRGTAGVTAAHGWMRYVAVSHSPGADIKGGHGKIVMCRDVSTGQMVAVKMQRADKQEALREGICAKAFRAMHHPNIARFLDMFVDGHFVCHVHALADTTLHHYVASRHFSYIPFDTANQIAGTIAAGLSFLHSLDGGPVAHGDLSDKNILLDGAGLDVWGGSCTQPHVAHGAHLKRQTPFPLFRAGSLILHCPFW